MLSRAQNLPQPKKMGPLWTQDEAIAYECAKEVISDLMGICSGKIAEEEAKQNPSFEEINRLKAERSNLFDERANLYLLDNDGIARIRREYGKKVRAHRGK